MILKAPSSLPHFNFRSALLSIRNYADNYPEPPGHTILYTIKTSNPYSLPYTLMSSYACYFFTPNRINPLKNSIQEAGNETNLYSWRGVIQPFDGLEISQVSPNEVVITSLQSLPKALVSYVTAVLGLDDTKKYDLPEQLNVLHETYPGVRVPRLYLNLLDVLIAVLCSTHASVTNGRRWFIFLKDYFKFIHFLPSENPFELMQFAKREIGVSMGYRARFVIQALSDLSKDGDWPEHNLRALITGLSVERARRNLLSIRYVGPKVADCFLLNTIGANNVPPVDVNVKRVCDRLKCLPNGFPPPQQNLCQHYLCEDNSEEACPRYIMTKEILEKGSGEAHNGCLRAALKLKFEHSGWVQALLFLHGIEFCQLRKPRCNKCPMSSMCEGPAKIESLLKISHEKPVKRFIGPWRKIGRPRKLLDLPETVFLYPEKASEVQNSINDLMKKLSASIKGSRRSKLACSVFISARSQGIPMIIQEVSEFYGIKSVQLFKLIQRALIHLEKTLSPPKPEEYADLLLRKLGLNVKDPEALKNILRTSYRPGLSPLPLASAALYLTLESEGKLISLRKISQASSISEVTLRKYRDYLHINR